MFPWGRGRPGFLLLFGGGPPRDRAIVAVYATVTTLAGLAFVAAGRAPRVAAEPAFAAAREDR
jgi:hypothetical protein